jgi:hypothetical protein
LFSINKIDSTQTGLPVQKEGMPIEERVALEAIEEVTKSLFEELPGTYLSDHEVVELLNPSVEEEAGQLAAEEEVEKTEAEESESEEVEEAEEGAKGTERLAKKIGRPTRDKRDVEDLFPLGSLPSAVRCVANSIILKMARRLEEAARERKRQRQSEDRKADELKRQREKEYIRQERKKSHAKGTKEKQQATISEGKYRKKKAAGISTPPPTKADTNP